jgi:hypothetical protein
VSLPQNFSVISFTSLLKESWKCSLGFDSIFLSELKAQPSIRHEERKPFFYRGLKPLKKKAAFLPALQE